MPRPNDVHDSQNSHQIVRLSSACLVFRAVVLVGLVVLVVVLQLVGVIPVFGTGAGTRPRTGTGTGTGAGAD